MKILQILGVSSLITLISFSGIFQSCEPKEEEEDTCDTCLMLYKPNIYIYPEVLLNLSVSIDFPLGGEVVTSIPEYGQGWNVTVDSTGLIDNTYTFLFYESTQPDVWQRDSGWLVQKNDLEVFFSNNMKAYGFEGHEIKDFTDYWIPRLTNSTYFTVYPQTVNTINNAVKLHFSSPPDNMLRLFYLVKGVDEMKISIPAPVIEGFTREGYVAAEWGVILE